MDTIATILLIWVVAGAFVALGFGLLFTWLDRP